MNKHRHKVKLSKESAWMYCVTPYVCSTLGERSHGNIMREDTCACGAKRLSESNGGRTSYGSWD